MLISIGNICTEFIEYKEDDLPSELRPYIVKNQIADARCTLTPVLPKQNNNKILYDSKATWRVEETSTGIVLSLLAGAAGTTIKKRYQELHLNNGMTDGAAYIDASQLTPGDSDFALRMPLLELWYTFMLMDGRGILVHGLGVKTESGVNIFAGKSGVGKSTLGGVFNAEKQGEILSDDRLIVRPAPPGEDGYYVYGTPWHGEARFASTSYGRLNNLFFLEHAKESSLSPLNRGVAAAQLFTCCFIAGWPRKEGLQFALDFCGTLVSEISASQLKFRPDVSTLKLLGYV